MLTFLVAALAAQPAVKPSTPCTISGVVTLDGKPSSAGTVIFLRREMDWVTLETTQATPDARGAFVFEKLPPGWYRVSAYHADAMPQAAGSWYCEGYGMRRSVTLAPSEGMPVVVERRAA